MSAESAWGSTRIYARSGHMLFARHTPFEVSREYPLRNRARRNNLQFDESRRRRLQPEYRLGVEIDGRIMDEAL